MITRRTSVFIISGLVSILALTLAPSVSTGAIESSGVGILPANPRADTPRSSSIFIYTATVGNTKTDAVTVFNNSDKTQTLELYATDSRTSSDGAFACAQQVETAKQVGTWITLDTTTVTLQAGESAEVPFRLIVPVDAEPGEHNGCMAVQATSQSSQTDKNGIALSFRSALRIAVTIPGNLRATIQFLRTHHETIDATTTRFSATVRNDGTVSTDTKFDVRLTGLWGTHRFASAAGTYPIFPKTDSTFNFELSNPFWGGWYRAVISASYHPPTSDGTLAKTAVDVSVDQPIIFITPQPLALLIETISLLTLVGGSVLAVLRHRQQQLARTHAHHHTVQAGETIASIADHYQANWRHIARLNRLKAPYSLTPNRQIAIPRHAARTPTAPNIKP